MTPPPPDASLPLGTIFQGGYEILSMLGTGSSAQVYRARQLSTGQTVALKVLHPALADTPAAVRCATEGFRRETQVCAELAHPHIVRLIDSGEAGAGLLYAVFQYVPGATLEEVLATEGPLSLRETVRLMAQVLDALSCAHIRGIVHRDLKPANIMILETGARRNATVLDFGLGGFVREHEEPAGAAGGILTGTPRYAAPEQLRGEPPSTRADLYSWGLIFLECLTGAPAVAGDSAEAIVRNQLSAERVFIPAALRDQPLGRVLRTVTAKEVQRRDVTIAGLLQALDAVEIGAAPAAEPVVAEEAAAYERRQVTVLCCRFSLAAKPESSPDLEELDQFLHAQQALCDEVAGRFGGRRAGVMSDRLILVFGYPHARENDARQAVRAALQIVTEVERAQARLVPERSGRLEIRAGVHTGVVVVPELRRVRATGIDQLVGVTPQIAEQLTDLAASGEVIVSRDTHRLLRGVVDAEPAGECHVSALGAPVAAFRLRGDARRGGGATPAQPVETAFVGRAEYLRDLVGGWQQASEGRGSAVLLSGEPGIGKSRLLRELRRRVPEDAWLECDCAAEYQNTPLQPIIDLLGGADQPIAAVLEMYGFDLEATVPLFSALLSIPLDERYPPLSLTAERQKELTLDALRTLLLKMSADRPRVLALENLHWADPTTLELAGLVLNSLRGADANGPRLYLVFTTRPEFVAPWPGEDVDRIPVERLGRADVEAMVSAGMAQGRAPSPELLKQVVRLADGVPLFVEELSRVLLESHGAAGTATQSPVDEPIDIPGSLRDLLSARLDVLSSSARDSAQLAAALGREFRYELLRAVSTKDQATLHDDVDELMVVGLLSRRGTGHREGYEFRHALIRDAAYDSMTRATRQRIHLRIANTLRERYPDLERGRPELLAQHFEHGGQPESAATYWHRAGVYAIERAAYAEAMILLDKGLALLRAIAPTPVRRRQEVQLLATLGTAHVATRGYAAAEVERAFGEASALCEELGDDIPLDVLYGIWGVQVTRSNRETTPVLVERFQRIVDQARDPRAILKAHACIGTAQMYDGDIPAADASYAAGRRLFDCEDFVRTPRPYALGGDLYVYAFGVSTLWHLGYADQAENLCQSMFSLIDRVRDPYATCVVIGTTTTFAHELGQADRELALAERLLSLAGEQRLLLWTAVGLCAQGGALVLRGQPGDAIPAIKQGLDLFQLIGLLSSHSYYHTYLADAYREAGLVAEGLATTEQGLGLTRTLAQRFHEPELWRLRGELFLLQGDADAAEEHLRQAIARAQRQNARSYELRAAMSLSRLLVQRRQHARARKLLADTYAGFTEGFDTLALGRARALLDELA